LFEILEYNKFPFFVKIKEAGARFLDLMEGLQKQAMEGIGSATTETDGSDLPISEEAKSALNSKTLGTSPKNSKSSTPVGD